MQHVADPVLRWLPTKLPVAEWIGENMHARDLLGFPDNLKADKRAQLGSGWTPSELNSILQNHVVNGALTSFGCVEWESASKAQCELDDIPLICLRSAFIL